MRRLIFIDTHRSLAITLALLAHAFYDFDVWANLPVAWGYVVQTMTRAATPSFILLFGAMLELVYVRKMESKGFDTVAYRLVKRGLQCYLGYILTVAAGSILGLFGPDHALRALFFVGRGHWGGILKFYAVALCLSIPLLAFRRRFGIGPTVLLCFCVWLLDPIRAALPVLGGFDRALDFVWGTVFHHFTFVGVGLLLGNVLRVHTNDTSLQYRRVHQVGAAVLAACAGISLWFFVQDGFVQTYLNFLDPAEFKVGLHIGYYSLGLILSLVMGSLLLTAFPASTQRPDPASPILGFGRSSLLSFTLGNVLLNGVAASEMSWSLLTGLLGTIVFFLLTFGLILFAERFDALLQRWPRAHRLVTAGSQLNDRVIVRPLSRVLLLISRPLHQTKRSRSVLKGS